MYRQAVNLLSVFTVLFFLMGCSTEDNGGEPGNSETPIAVHPLEAVTIELSSSLSADKYQGTFGGESIELVKLDDTHVMFMVPSDMVEGKANLNVNTLGLEKAYDVSHLDLEGSPQEVFGQFLADAQMEIQGLEEYPGAANASDYLTELENSFNNASETEKKEAALLYQVNRQLIQDILKGNLEEGAYSTPSSTRSSNKQSSTASLSNLVKFKLYVLAVGASATAAVIAPVDPLSKSLLAAVAVIASYKALKYHDKLAKTELTKLNVLINDLRSALKQQEEKLKFTHDTSRELNLRIEQRTFNSSDEGNSNENVATFFSAHNSLSGIIQKINNVIDYVNDNLFLSDMDNIDEAELDESNPSVVSVESSLYENFNFTVASDKVEISEITYDSGLSIKFLIKDVENLSQDYIDTELNYSYSDDFNDFSGSFDIRVNKEEEFDYEGTWLFQYSCWDGECRTEIKFIMDASGKSISSEYRGRNPNDFSWNEWVDYHITYYLLYNSSNETLRLTNNYYTSNVHYFQVDSIEQTEFIIRSDDPESTSYLRLVKL